MSPFILDLIVLIVIFISAILAMVRGFVREVLSIASWLVAVAAAYYLYKPLLPLVKPYIANGDFAAIIAAACVFFVALIVASYLTTKISDFVIDSRIGAVDRGLGFLFGAARGILLLVIALLFFSWLVPNAPSWVANAHSKPILDDLGQKLMAALPDDIESEIMKHVHSGGDDTAAGGDASPPDDSASQAAPTPSYRSGTRQNLDQLIQNSDN
jgi:membrane protein required for colicin V production